MSEPAYRAEGIELYLADCRAMDFLAAGSIDCVITSPPYYSLRKYSDGAELDWPDGWHGQLGQEPRVADYIRHLVETCREFRRVLKPWGVFVVNIGDAYAGSGGAGGDYGPGGLKEGQPKYPGNRANGLPALSKMMIPARVAIALQEDGWLLRSEMVWHKVSPMPESTAGWRWERCRVKVKSASDTRGNAERRMSADPGLVRPSDDRAEWQDCPGCARCAPNGGYILRKGNWRPTTAHEMVYVFSKGRPYFGDGESVRLPLAQSSVERGKYPISPDPQGPYRQGLDDSRPVSEHQNAAGANLRSVVQFSRAGGGYPGSHYATFPVSLPELFIKAFTSERGNCPQCGMPWARCIDHKTSESRQGSGYLVESGRLDGGGKRHGSFVDAESTTLSWRPSCSCGAGDPVPALVCDPFGGVGSTAMAARKLGRRCVSVDIVPKYLELAKRRLQSREPEDEKIDGKTVEQGVMMW